jgi:hypothetical protein
MTMCRTLLGFHTFTLCSATCTSNSSDRFSYWIIIWSSSHSLHGGGHLYVPSSASGKNHEPFLGAFSQVCKLRERIHIAAMIHTSQVCKLENVSHSCTHQQVPQPPKQDNRWKPTKGGVIATLSSVPRYDTLRIKGTIQRQ